MAILSIDADGWTIERIEIPHEKKEALPATDGLDMRKTIETVVGETKKGRSVDAIADCRLPLTER